MLKRVLLCTCLSCVALPSQAGETAVSLHGDLIGGGLEITRPISEEFNGRIGYHEGSYQGSDFLAQMEQLSNWVTDLFGWTKSKNNYNYDGKQQMLSFVADWYPDRASQFRYSLGLGYLKDNSTFVGIEQVTGGYNLGGTSYSAGQVGKLSGTKKNIGFAPYVGIGWGDPIKKENGWGFTFDMGFHYTGKPSVTLTATGTPSPEDLEAERQRIQKDSLDFTPTLSLGASYRW